MKIYEDKFLFCRKKIFEKKGEVLVVSFQQRLPENSDFSGKQKGFSENFLNKNKINHILVLIKENHWYQVSTVESMIESLKRDYDYKKAKRIVLYGQSMGGYACLLFNQHFNEADILAISPLYSNDSKLMPQEKRWESDRLNFRCEVNMPQLIKGKRNIWVLFDPNSPDNHHVERLDDSAEEIFKVPLPFSGHPSSVYLSDLGLLSSFSLSFIKNFDPENLLSLVKHARLSRRKSKTFYINLLRHARTRKRKEVINNFLKSSVIFKDKDSDQSSHSLLVKNIPEKFGEVLRKDDPETLDTITFPSTNDSEEHIVLLLEGLRTKEFNERLISAITKICKKSFFHSNDIQLALGRLQHSRGLYVEAIESYLRVMDLGKEYPYLDMLVGECYKSLSKYTKALFYFNKAISLNPKNDSFYIKKANTLICIEDFDEAEAVFLNAISLFGYRLTLVNNFSFFLITQGRYEEAFELLGRADINHPLIKNRLESVQEKLSKLE